MPSQSVLAQLQSLPWPEIKSRAGMHLPKIMLVILVVLLTKTLAELTWSFFDSSPDASPVKQVVPRARLNQGSGQQASGLEQVTKYNLFGVVTRTPVQTQKVIDAPETRLRLTLKGVFASTNPKNALAIISSSKGSDKTYHIGDKVTGGAELHSIYSDRVILQRNGQLETLRLPKPKMGNASVSTVPVSRTGAANQVSSRHASVKSDRFQRQQLRQIRDTLVKDPAKLWKQVRINPVMDGGKVKGYSLTHNNRRLMESLDLKPTDVITQVDGKDLSDPASLYGLLNNLSAKTSLNVTIERNGQQQMVQLNF